MSTGDIGFAVILLVIACWHLGSKYIDLKYGKKDDGD